MNLFIVALLSVFFVAYFSMSIGTIIKFSDNKIVFNGFFYKTLALLTLPILILYICLKSSPKNTKYRFFNVFLSSLVNYPLHVTSISTTLLYILNNQYAYKKSNASQPVQKKRSNTKITLKSNINDSVIFSYTVEEEPIYVNKIVKKWIMNIVATNDGKKEKITVY